MASGDPAAPESLPGVDTRTRTDSVGHGATAPAPRTPAPSLSRLGRFRIERVLGEGGMVRAAFAEQLEASCTQTTAADTVVTVEVPPIRRARAR